MVLISGQEAMVIHNPAVSFQVYQGAGCIPFVPDHRPTGKTLLLEWSLLQPHNKEMCQRKHHEEGVRGGKGLWHPIIVVLGYHWLSSQFLKSISSAGASITPIPLWECWDGPTHRLAFSERADSSQGITGLACRKDIHNHFPSPKTIFNTIKRGRLNGSEQMENFMGNRWELLQRQTEMCFKKT